MKVYGYLFGIDQDNKDKVLQSVRAILTESGYTGIQIYLCGCKLSVIAIDLQPERKESIIEITNHPQQPHELFVFYRTRPERNRYASFRN